MVLIRGKKIKEHKCHLYNQIDRIFISSVVVDVPAVLLGVI